MKFIIFGFLAIFCLSFCHANFTPDEFLANVTSSRNNFDSILQQEISAQNTDRQELSQSILLRLRYPTDPGAFILGEQISKCYPATYRAVLFNSRYNAFHSSLYMNFATPVGKVTNAFERAIASTTNDFARRIDDVLLPLNNSVNSFVTGFREAVRTNNQSRIAVFQQCSTITFNAINNLYIELLNVADTCLEQRNNFGRTEDALVDLFMNWNQMFTSISGCCALTNVNNNSSLLPQYLDGESLAIDCLERFSFKLPYSSSVYQGIYPSVDLEDNTNIFAISLRVAQLTENTLLAGMAFQNNCLAKMVADVRELVNSINNLSKRVCQ